MKHFLEQREKRNIGIDNNKIKKTYTMNVSLPPPETIHVHFPHFLLSAFAAWKVAGFVSKTYVLRPQDLCSSPARP